MKSLPVAVSLVLVGAAALFAVARPIVSDTPKEVTVTDDPGPLEEAMDAINTSVRRAARLLKKSDFERCITEAVVIQKSAMEARNHEPPMAKDMPAEKKAKFLVGYRKELNNLIRTALTLEDAALDQNKEAGLKAVDALKALKKSSHEVYAK